jgi:hypothetical protein
MSFCKDDISTFGEPMTRYIDRDFSRYNISTFCKDDISVFCKDER